MLAEIVEAETVCRRINQAQQAILQYRDVGWIDPTLEDRTLNALAVVLAGLCHFSQAALSIGRFGADVITDHDQGQGSVLRCSHNSLGSPMDQSSLELHFQKKEG